MDTARWCVRRQLCLGACSPAVFLERLGSNGSPRAHNSRAGCLDGRELILGKSLDGSQVSALSVGQNGEMTLHMRHYTSYIFMSIYSSLSIYLDDDRSIFTSHEDPEPFFLFAEGQRSCRSFCSTKLRVNRIYAITILQV